MPRPTIPAKLRKGKAIGAIPNFAATFNWVVDFCQNLRGGVGIDLDRTNQDHPVVRLRKNALDLGFWRVKYDATDGWIVNIPQAVVTLAGCTVLNTAATAANWYKVQGAPANNTTAFRTTVHVKRRVVTASESPHAAVLVDGNGAANAYAGDCWSALIADIDSSGNVTQVFSKRVDFLETVAPGQLEPYWAFSGGTLTPHSPAMTNAPICGGAVADTALPASGSANVWYLIDCTGASPAPSVTTTRTPATGKIYVNVYDLQNGCMTADVRINLANAVFYP